MNVRARGRVGDYVNGRVDARAGGRVGDYVDGRVYARAGGRAGGRARGHVGGRARNHAGVHAYALDDAVGHREWLVGYCKAHLECTSKRQDRLSSITGTYMHLHAPFY